jgi:excisionase family DNA binding protein
MALTKRPVPTTSRVVQPEPLLLSLEEVSGMLGVSRGHVVYLVNQGVLAKVQLGRRVLIPREDLLRFIADSRTLAVKQTA